MNSLNKNNRKKVFFVEMDHTVPLIKLVGLIQPHAHDAL